MIRRGKEELRKEERKEEAVVEVSGVAQVARTCAHTNKLQTHTHAHTLRIHTKHTKTHALSTHTLSTHTQHAHTHTHMQTHTLSTH